MDGNMAYVDCVRLVFHWHQLKEK